MVATRQQAVERALNSTTNVPRYCARWTRERFGVPALGDFDGDGAADAEDMWKAARIRNEGDTNPPAGVPVYWGGGSQDNGHIAVSLGGGMVRSTDAAGPGRVGTVPLDFPTREWEMPYLGWSEDLYGHDIPDPEGDLRRSRLAKLEVTRRRKAKWQRWVKRANKNIARLRGLTK